MHASATTSMLPELAVPNDRRYWLPESCRHNAAAPNRLTRLPPQLKYPALPERIDLASGLGDIPMMRAPRCAACTQLRLSVGGGNCRSPSEGG